MPNYYFPDSFIKSARVLLADMLDLLECEESQLGKPLPKTFKPKDDDTYVVSIIYTALQQLYLKFDSLADSNEFTLVGKALIYVNTFHQTMEKRYPIKDKKQTPAICGIKSYEATKKLLDFIATVTTQPIAAETKADTNLLVIALKHEAFLKMIRLLSQELNLNLTESSDAVKKQITRYLLEKKWDCIKQILKNIQEAIDDYAINPTQADDYKKSIENQITLIKSILSKSHRTADSHFLIELFKIESHFITLTKLEQKPKTIDGIAQCRT